MDILYILILIASLVGGIIGGTQLTLLAQVLIMVVAFYLFNKLAPSDITALIYLFPIVIFMLGLILGDISWLIQTGGEGVSLGSFWDLFIVE